MVRVYSNQYETGKPDLQDLKMHKVTVNYKNENADNIYFTTYLIFNLLQLSNHNNTSIYDKFLNNY